MTEREQLLKEAGELGLKFARNVKTEALKDGIEQAKALKEADKAVEDAGGEPVRVPTPPTEAEIREQLEAEFEEKMKIERAKMSANMELNLAKKGEEASVGKVTVGQAKLRARRDATKLVGVNVTCKDPLKTNWEGEIFTVSNDVVGDIKKYVQFDTEDGWHVPQMIVNMLKTKKCTVFKQKKGRDGKYVSEPRVVNAFSIEYLEPLTADELDELARQQRAEAGTD